MTIVGAGEVPISPTFPGFRDAVVGEVDAVAAEAGGRFSAAFGKAMRGVAIGITAGVAAASAGVAAIASKGLDRALNIQDAKAQLTGLGHSADSVSTIMESALASVKGTAFGLDQSAQIAASSVAAGVRPGEDLTRVLKLTADSATIAKKPLSEMGEIINKVATNQRLTTDTLQQFQNRSIPLLQAVADHFGVTADEAAAMVSRGEVDFAAFQAALESSVGGAALSSGTTARGAFANIGAAFSRMGAMFVQPAVDGSPALFQSIAGAVDRATTALAPFAAQLATRIGPAMAALSTWVDGIDFGKIITGVTEFYRGAVDVKDLLLTGFTEDETLLPASVVNGLRVAHDVFAAIGGAVRDMFAAFQGGGDFSGVSAQFGSIGTSVATLQPAFELFVSSLPNVGGALATLAAAGVDVLTQGLSFLADNVDTIIAFMPVIVAGFLAWKVATGVVFASQQNLALLQMRMMPLTTANTFARLAAARAELQLAAATGTSTAAQSGGLLATVRGTAALVAQKVALVATRGAMIVATAAQWAWNAALTANPIGIIIAAIAALVAGLIWFFTQTDLGRAIWENFTAVVAAVVTWLWESVLSPVFTAIGAIVTWLYENVIVYVIAGIVTYVQIWAAIFVWLWQNVLSPLFGAIGNGIAWVYENAIRPAVDAIVAGFTWAGDAISGIRQTILTALEGIGSWLTSAGGDLVRGFWDGISGMGGWLLDQVGGFFDGVVGWAKDTLGIQSPSRVFRAEVGQMVGEGMALGITDSSTLVEQAMLALTAVPPAATTAQAAATNAGGAPAGPGAQITQNNYFAEMDPEDAIEAAGQRAAAVAGRAGL